ncbi:hypothetical protein [Lysobacter sp. CA199]|uniref:hypothetical protein n=1 Tax=Lysobacter sp. CA199 TaxID=3455608 RepID=UPI003F8D55E4
MSKNFKAGDQVVRINSSFYGGCAIAAVGQRATVIDTDNAGVRVTFDFEGKPAEQTWMNTNTRLWVESNQAGKFKPGDRVIRIKHNNGNAAKVGQIATVSHTIGGFVYVTYEGCKGCEDGRGGLTEGWAGCFTALYMRAPESHGVTPTGRLSVAAPRMQTLAPPPDLNWTELRSEASRTYHFPDNQRITVERVVRLCVRPSGHRLETADGKKFIIPGKFIAIETDAKEWSA